MPSAGGNNGGPTCHHQEAQQDHVQAQRGGEDQAQQQGQVPQMEEEVVGLLPLLARGGIGHDLGSERGRREGGQWGEEEEGRIRGGGHPIGKVTFQTGARSEERRRAVGRDVTMLEVRTCSSSSCDTHTETSSFSLKPEMFRYRSSLPETDSDPCLFF